MSGVGPCLSHNPERLIAEQFGTIRTLPYGSVRDNSNFRTLPYGSVRNFLFFQLKKIIFAVCDFFTQQIIFILFFRAGGPPSPPSDHHKNKKYWPQKQKSMRTNTNSADILIIIMVMRMPPPVQALPAPPAVAWDFGGASGQRHTYKKTP